MEATPKQKVQEFIKDFRLSMDWTQKDLAERLKIHQVIVSQYESGKRTPAADFLFKLADLAGMEVGLIEKP